MIKSPSPLWGEGVLALVLLEKHETVMTLTEFLHMGGYAFYVWTSYGLAAVILIANLLIPMLSARRQRRELIGKLRREGRA